MSTKRTIKSEHLRCKHIWRYPALFHAFVVTSRSRLEHLLFRIQTKFARQGVNSANNILKSSWEVEWNWLPGKLALWYWIAIVSSIRIFKLFSSEYFVYLEQTQDKISAKQSDRKSARKWLAILLLWKSGRNFPHFGLQRLWIDKLNSSTPRRTSEN